MDKKFLKMGANESGFLLVTIKESSLFSIFFFFFFDNTGKLSLFCVCVSVNIIVCVCVLNDVVMEKVVLCVLCFLCSFLFF